MSPKWISSFGTSYDFVQGNIGQNLTITRVGESFLISAAFNVDATRNVTGIGFTIEPRVPAQDPAGQRQRRPNPAGRGVRIGIGSRG